MKRQGRSVCLGSRRFRLALLLPAAIVVSPLWGAVGQQDRATGAIEFVARVTPTAGRPEPVRQMTFYLLRKSLADIEKEVEEAEPKHDLARFVDALEVSKELKAWMKKARWVELAGAEFIRRVGADDILEVPEFYAAYLKRNSGYAPMGLPAPKYRESDRERHAQRYERQRQEYRQTVRKYIENNPQSIEGIDADLDAINPAQLWAQQVSELRQRVRRRALVLAQTRYLAAKTDTDLDGRGILSGLAPGAYWLGTLETQAIAGDVRLRWDAAVTVRSGQTTRLELSNLNSLP